MGGLTTRIEKLFRRKGKLKAENFLSVIIWGVASLTVNDAYVHLVLTNSARAGHITSNINGIVFISLTALEVVLAPILGYFGRSRRTNLITVSFALTVLVTIPLMFLPYDLVVANGYELCGAPTVAPVPGSILPTIQITIVIMFGVVSIISKTTLMTHGIALLDEHEPGKVPFYLAKVFGVRLIMWTAAYYFVGPMLEWSVVVQGVVLVAPIAVLVVVLLVLYPTASMYDDHREWKTRNSDGGYLASISRVVRNKSALFHMLSMAFLLAPAWIMALNNADIVKIKYQILLSNSNAYEGIVKGILNQAVAFMILIVGYNISTPICTEFNRLTVAKKSIIFSILGIGFLVAILLLECGTDSTMEGVGEWNYTQPACSLSCGCSYPYNEYSPVCVLDDMTTYYSPCHAGCSVREDVNGVTILGNCLCSASGAGRAVLGACDHFACSKAYALHQLLYPVFSGHVAMVVLLNITSILRCTDPRDKALAVGVTLAVVSLIAFVFGHLAYWLISEITCNWYEGSSCEVHNKNLVPYITILTTTLAGISAAINIGLWFSARKHSSKCIEVSKC